MKTEVKLLQKYEKNVGNDYDRVMFVAKKEATIFDEMIGSHKSLVAPLGVDYNYFSEELSVIKKKHSIVFMGALNVAHNEYGIIHFIKCCFPIILEEVPDAKLYIIGGGASDELKKYASNSIIFLGRVPDVRAPIKECEVFICPLQFGSGIKTKNLEAMAMGIPIVTTSIGAENIDANDNIDWLIADNDEDFAKCVVELIYDTEKQQKVSLNGKKFVKENFTWDCSQKAFEEALLRGINR